METTSPAARETPTSRQRILADLALAGVAMIWGSAFVVQRLAAASSGVYLFNGLRFLLAALALAPAVWLRRRAGMIPPARGLEDWKQIAPAGMILATGASLQQAGLQYTTAGNAGFVTGLYVIFIPVLLALIWRRRVRRSVWIAGLLAAAGLFLLSSGGRLQVNPGDALELAGAVFWAAHVIVVGRAVQHLDVLQFAAGQYLVCGFLNTVLGLWLEQAYLPELIAGGWMLAYAGLLSVGIGYTLQAGAQRFAPPADAAIILSSEAVFAALFGRLFLGEALGVIQLAGCGLMLAGILLAQSDVWFNRRGQSTVE